MTVELLSRLQFGLTVSFHYIFPPLSIGLGLMLVVMEGLFIKTKNKFYQNMTKFWARVFGLIFSIGVATGIVMEFQFGTNWSYYSRYVGDVFGSALAAEGIFAFFLESGFLALVIFGWDRLRPRTHFFATTMVAFGSVFSAIWIVVANSWQQTPAGYRIVQHEGITRAEITDFWSVLFSPSSMDRLSHVLCGAVQAGAFFVLSVSAYYLLKRKHLDFAKSSMKIALLFATIFSILQLVTGDTSAEGVSQNQPPKLAAFEGHFEASAPAGLYLLGWVDEKNEKVTGLQIPGLLSFLVHGDTTKPIAGLRAFKPSDRPPVNVVFQSYHLMVALGMFQIGLSLLGLFYWWRKTLFEKRWLLAIMVISVLSPQLANQLGWFSAEVGRQPWIVYGLLRTADGISPTVTKEQVLTSLGLFTLVYGLLFAVFIYLLDHKIKHGPLPDIDAEKIEEEQRA